jgi:hypothetical protein
VAPRRSVSPARPARSAASASRVGQQDLVLRVGEREQDVVQDLDAAGAHHDLLRRRLVAVDPADLLRERLAQRRDAGVRRVLRMPVARRAGSRLDDVRRRGEAGLADLEVERVGRRQATSMTSRMAWGGRPVARAEIAVVGIVMCRAA